MKNFYYEEVPYIVERIAASRPQTILEVGIGIGKWGFLCRELFEETQDRFRNESWGIRIDGIESVPQYQPPIFQYIYDNVYAGELNQTIDDLPAYDVVIADYVLQQFSKEKGLALLEKLLAHTRKMLFMVVPKEYDRQRVYTNQRRELSRWINVDFSGYDFVGKVISASESGEGQRIFTFYPKVKNTPQEASVKDRLWNKKFDYQRKKLTVGYLIPHHNLTGGMKILIQQMKELRRLGHRVNAIYRAETGTALPPWAKIEVDQEILVPTKATCSAYLEGCDVVVAGFFNQLHELRSANVPVLYIEQGSEYLYGDFLNIQNTSELRDYLWDSFNQPLYLATISPILEKIIAGRFGRKTAFTPNGIDTDLFYPGTPLENNTILLVGNPNLEFKGFQVALAALQKLWQQGVRFKVKWVAQVGVEISGISYPLEIIENPPQSEIPCLYREATIFLFTSWYESFALPPLEAMASGVPVVATKCGGISTYAKEGVNALLVEPGNADGLAKAMQLVLTDSQFSEKLRRNGRETALQFSWKNSIKYLEDALLKIVANETKSNPEEFLYYAPKSDWEKFVACVQELASEKKPTNIFIIGGEKASQLASYLAEELDPILRQNPQINIDLVLEEPSIKKLEEILEDKSKLILHKESPNADWLEKKAKQQEMQVVWL